MERPLRLAMVAVLLVVSLAESAEARGRRGRRARCCRSQCCVPACPTPAPPRPASHGTVELLATQLAQVMQTLNAESQLSVEGRRALEQSFRELMGDALIDNPALVNQILQDEFVVRDEVEDVIGGEVKDVSRRLQGN